MYFLIYVDDIVINGGDDKDVLALIDLLRKKFALKHLGILNYFLGTKGNYFTKWWFAISTIQVHFFIFFTRPK